MKVASDVVLDGMVVEEVGFRLVMRFWELTSRPSLDIYVISLS